jgi:DNA repair protein RadC
MSVYEIKVSYAARDSGASAQQDRHVLIRNSKDVISVMAPLLEPEVVEVCYVLCLTAPLTLIGYHLVSRGSLSETLMHPREVFKAAVLANAAGIVLVHNHPSGNPTPSRTDLEVTNRLRTAGEVMGIELLDHIIIGHHGLFVSLREGGQL